jgi:hypothetical protein
VRKMVSRARARLGRFLRSECGLYDSRAPCRCRMRSRVEEVNLPAEYEKLRRIVSRARLFKESEEILSMDCHMTPSPATH